MTQSSEHGYFYAVPSLSAAYLTDEEPYDTGLIRDVVVNNLLHGYDEAFQARVCWLLKDTSEALEPTTTSASQSYPLPQPVGVFPIHLRADGRSPKLVCRLHARHNGAGSSQFWVVWRGFTGIRGEADDPLPLGTNVGTATTSSSSFAWLDTGGGALDPYVLELPQGDVELGKRRMVMERDSGGDLGEVIVAMTRVDVYARRISGSGTPQVAGFACREYVG